MINGIAHLCLSAKDLSVARHFYCDVLGLKKQFDFVRKAKEGEEGKDEQVIGFYLQVAGQMFIEIFQNDTIPAEPGAIRHLCLETDDIDQMIQQVRSRGWKIGEKEMGADFSWQVWLKAPDGVDIEFHQYTPQSCQRTGEPCRVAW